MTAGEKTYLLQFPYREILGGIGYVARALVRISHIHTSLMVDGHHSIHAMIPNQRKHILILNRSDQDPAFPVLEASQNSRIGADEVLQG